MSVQLKMIIFVATLVICQLFQLTSAKLDLSNVKVELVPETPITTFGDGPHWDERLRSLLYVNILGTPYTIYRYCPHERRVYGANVPNESVVSFIIPVEGTKDQYVVGITHRVAIIIWNGIDTVVEIVRIITEVENCPEFATNAINDGKADRYGRLYTGSRRNQTCLDRNIPTVGNLFRINNDGTAVTLRENIFVSNGMCFNDATDEYYYIDSCAKNVKAYDWDPETGDISHGRVITRWHFNGSSFADGMTIDRTGRYLIIAVLGQSRIRIVDLKRNEIAGEIEFPVLQPVSVAFGGDRYDVLYATSGAADLFNGPQADPAGRLFVVKGLKLRGRPHHKVRFY